MGVAHARNVVVRVQVTATVDVEHPDPVGLREVDRRLVAERLQGRAHDRRPTVAQRGPSGSRQRYLRAEPPCHVIPADLQERGDRPRDRAVVAFGKGGVLQAAVGAPRRDRDGDRGPGGQQFPEQPQLQRFQRRDPLIAIQDEAGDPEQLVRSAPVEQRVEDAREIDDQRRMTHVAEVHDARDPAPIVDQGVVGRQVGVDDLGAE